MQEKILSSVFKKLAELKAKEEAAAQAVADEAFSIPELNKCDAALRLNGFETVKAEADGRDISALLENEKKLETEFEKLLTEHGYKKEDFEPKYTCPVCRDTGKVGNSLCECAKKLYVAEVKKAAALDKVAPFKFSDCDFSAIADGKDRAFLEDTYKKAEIYCKMFSASKTQNMLLTGATGTGKTCVASAVANELNGRGFTVIFESAFEFLQKMREIHFSSPDERGFQLEDFLTADLLVIDDLGIEQIYKNITREYLLLVLCERESRGKSTIVTTNLGDKLLERYGDRITSRLTNPKNTLIRNFNGNDLRTHRK